MRADDRANGLSPRGDATQAASGASPSALRGRPRGSGARKLDPASRERLGDSLKAMYQTIAQQPVPDRFKDLIEQLDSRRDETDG